MAGGIVAAFYYIMNFLSTKTYYNLETTFTLFGACLLYTILAIFGFIFMYVFLPETEGKTLEDIERHFSDKKIKITNHKIASEKLLKGQEVLNE